MELWREKKSGVVFIKVLAMSNKRIANLRAELAQIVERDQSIDNPNGGNADFPELRVFERRQLLNLASCLLLEWSTNFVKLSNKHKIWISLWLNHLEEERT